MRTRWRWTSPLFSSTSGCPARPSWSSGCSAGAGRGQRASTQLRTRCRRDGVALLLLGGEADPDAELAELSLAPAGAVAQAFEYLRHGGVDNTRELLRFLADTFGLEGHGFDPPRELAEIGDLRAGPRRRRRPARAPTGARASASSSTARTA